MSIAIMTEAWRLQGLSITQKLVLLSLADNANDQGECYPSIGQIVSRTGASERTVQAAIRALEEIGYVRSHTRRGTSTLYTLDLRAEPKNVIHNPRKSDTPASGAPPQDLPPTPAADAPQPPQQMHPTPANVAPKPSVNHQLNRQVTVKPDRAKPAKAAALIAMELPDWLPRQSWADWVEHREAVRAPLTTRAATLGIHHLGKLMDEGNDPVEVIEQSVRTGRWTDFYPLKNPGQGKTGMPPPNRQEALEARNREVAERFARGA